MMGRIQDSSLPNKLQFLMKNKTKQIKYKLRSQVKFEELRDGKTGNCKSEM